MVSDPDEAPFYESTSCEESSSYLGLDRGRMEDPFSEESAQTLCEEIEVLHQSPDGWGPFPQRGTRVRGGEGVNNRAGDDTWPVGRYYNDSLSHWSSDDPGPRNERDSKPRLRDKDSINSSSQEKSVSTWFPVPSLSIFQSNSQKNTKPGSSPLSSQSSKPFDEMPQLADTSSSFHSASPFSFSDEFSRGSPTLRRPLRNRESDVGKRQRGERPWQNNSQQKGSKYSPLSRHPKSQVYDTADNGERSISPQNLREMDSAQQQNNVHGNPSNSIRSIHGQRNSSLLASPHESFRSNRSGHRISQYHPYNNPFDSISLSSSDHLNRPSSKIRPSSKSPVRQKLVRPSPSRIKDESKLHNLLSCATSPCDPKWMEALHILATSPNPRRLAQMKIPHAHNWTALHISSLSNPPLFLIYGLLLVYPEAVKDVDSGGRLPIHLAAGSEAASSVLSILVRFFSESVTIEEGRGLIPLHLALLRDSEEVISLELMRVLLGQSSTSTSRGNATSKVKDGSLRRGEHLSLGISEVKDGIFGDNPNTVSMKERQKRERRMQSMNSQNRHSFSRGFAVNTDDISFSDGIPQKHEYLSSLWQEEGVVKVQMFGEAEIQEAEGFTLEVQHCLKKLARWKKSFTGDDESLKQKSDSNEGYPMKINPAHIPAPPNMRLPIHMAIKRYFQVPEPDLLPPSKQNDLLRILIHANPSSLVYRDNLDKTPIFACLELCSNNPSHPINLEMVELLLGIRTAGYRVAPKWLEDIDIVDSQQRLTRRWSNDNFDDTAYNPAMVPCHQTLPLHVAALQPLPSLVTQTIYSSYPGAKYVQDERKRTPLHCALEHENRSDPLDLDILCLLIDNKVVRTRDVLNRSVLDLLFENGRKGRIPLKLGSFIAHDGILEDLPRKNVTYQLKLLFQYAMIEASASSDMRITSVVDALDDLRDLPQWMRKIACETSVVQRLLLKKVSSPLSTMLILMNGLVLLILTIFFISSIDTAINDLEKVPRTSYMIVFFSLIYLSLNGLCYSLTTFRLKIGWDQCVANFRSWVTILGLSTVFISTIHMNRDTVDDFFIFACTASIGFVWAMMIAYLSRWCYGISMFCLSALKMVQKLLSTLLVMMIFFVAFMQMIYLTQRRSFGFDNQCIYAENKDSIEVCSIWESIKMSYFFVVGGGFLYSDDNETVGIDILLLILTTVSFILIVHAVAISIVNMKRLKLKESMVDFFWIPMFIHVQFVKDVRSIFCCGKKAGDSAAGSRSYSEKNNYVRTSCGRCCSTIEDKLYGTWEYLCASSESNRFKEAKLQFLDRNLGNSFLFTNIVFVRLISIFVVPLWFILGLVTLGLLWSPQCRLWLFTWSFDKSGESDGDEPQKEEDMINSSSTVKEDVSRMKGMVFERFHDVQSELQTIKRYLS